MNTVSPRLTFTGRLTIPSTTTATDLANPMLDDDEDEATSTAPPPASPPPAPRPAPRPVRSEVAPRRASRFEFTEDYLAALRWTDKARYTSREQLAVFLDKDLRSAGRVLDRLVRLGHIDRKAFDGFPTGFYLTPTGKDIIESDSRGVDSKTGPRAIRHSLAVSWTILGILKGELRWGEYAAKALGRPVELDDFLSETEVARAVHQQKGKVRDELERRAKQATGKAFAKDWEAWDELSARVAQSSSDVELGDWERYVWAAWTESGKPHVPDLVLRLPRDSKTGLPRSLAFEIERSYKPESVGKMLEDYDKNLSGGDAQRAGSRFHSCMWVCGDSRIAGLIESMSRGDKRHKVSTSRDTFGWRAAYLARLEEERLRRSAEHQAVRQRGLWHVRADATAVPCVCGTTCKTRYGTFESQQAAVEFAGSLS